MDANDHFQRALTSIKNYVRENNLVGATVKKFEISISLTKEDGGKVSNKSVLSDDDIVETFTHG